MLCLPDLSQSSPFRDVEPAGKAQCWPSFVLDRKVSVDFQSAMPGKNLEQISMKWTAAKYTILVTGEKLSLFWNTE